MGAIHTAGNEDHFPQEVGDILLRVEEYHTDWFCKCSCKMKQSQSFVIRQRIGLYLSIYVPEYDIGLLGSPFKLRSQHYRLLMRLWPPLHILRSNFRMIRLLLIPLWRGLGACVGLFRLRLNPHLPVWTKRHAATSSAAHKRSFKPK